MANSTLGIGAPINPIFIPWGTSPYSQQGPGLNPYLAQQLIGQPNLPFVPLAASPYGAQPLQQQVYQLLQVVPQQLQQLQQLVVTQQQQLQQIQQLLQLIPSQLVQVHQLIQLLPQLLQSVPASTAFAATPPWGFAPQMFAQPGHVM
jgi:hypothetical protein